MDFEVIEEEVKKVCKNIKPEKFVFELLAAYGKSKTTITRLSSGDLNQSKKDGSVIILKKNLYFKASAKSPKKDFDDLLSDESVLRHDPRFVIATDFKKLFALDTKTQEQLETDVAQLPLKFDFFLPWAGIEKKEFQHENPVDVKAAQKLAKLFDLIRKDNPKSDPKSLHSLNVFLTRLLFCYFAEDTEIFPKALFTHSVGSHTQEDGKDVPDYLEKVFEIMNVAKRPKNTPEYLSNFPYVNGGLFAEKHPIPKFSKASRNALLENGDLDWASINPDIFGSMIQAVVDPQRRTDLGIHYTSVTNIMKVIRPLFLEELYEEFEKTKGKDNKNKLKKLLQRIREIKIFDPACGSGNFLIIAYKELRILEMKIIAELKELPLSSITLSNFFGIEIDDFAHEVAKLSLWLVQHQMNVVFQNEFGESSPSLPLKESGKIYCGNAVRLDWKKVCPSKPEEEIYILGNPPYLGARNQTDGHKDDLKFVFQGHEDFKDADYVICWFLKASEYIKNVKAKAAFVSTNSVAQGEQVGILWSRILAHKLEIDFAHKSFKWINNAKDKAGVICVIVGIRNPSNKNKLLFEDGRSKVVANISPYLCSGNSTLVFASKKPLNNLPKATMGNMARDGGNLILSTEEKDALVKEYPKANQLLRAFVGAQGLMHGTSRWCLWISDEQLELAKSIPPIKKRIDNVYNFRMASDAKTTNGYSSIPHKFAQRSLNKGNVILIPRHTSERRYYVPFGFFDEMTIIADSAHAIFQAETWLFGLISSRMHMVWVKTVAGRLKADYRYSAELCYNTFPIPQLNETQKQNISNHVFTILKIREKYTQHCLGDLYDPDKMPDDLKAAHQDLDKAIEDCYRSKAFTSDEERIEYLFSLYEKMLKEHLEKEENDD